MFRILMPLLACAILCSCTDPVQQEPIPIVKLENYQKSTWQELYTLGDERSVAGVMAYLSNSDAELRTLAAKLAGSLQDSLLLPALHKNLLDSVTEVQIASAWAIGQIGNKGSTGDLIKKASLTNDVHVKASIYEALGKCISIEDTKALSVIPSDSIAITGWLKGWYRLVLRDREVKLPDAVGQQIKSTDAEILTWALHIFSRCNSKRSSEECQSFLDVIQSSGSEANRMTAIASCKNCELVMVEKNLRQIAFDLDENELVRTNAVRALSSLNADSQRISPHFLSEGGHDYSLTMAQWFAKSEEFECKDLDIAEREFSPEIHALLLTANVERCNPEFWEPIMMDSISKSSSDYSKMFYLRALPYSENTRNFISSILDSEDNPRILSTCADKISAWGNEGHAINDLIEKVLGIRDAGAIASIAYYLKNSDLEMSLDSNDFNALLSECVLPREVETYNELIQAKNHLFGTGSPLHVPEYNHPIDWKEASKISPHQKVRISTSKGDILIQLETETAIGTVTDFVRLMEEQYFNQKTFHRVVPNFVIQGGCPRGDGWGSQDYTIRSEFSDLPYAEGTVGMASAGPDTESCQWFITHSATPHLEGRYTIFANVIEGMDVVNQIQVGDEINSVTLE